MAPKKPLLRLGRVTFSHVRSPSCASDPGRDEKCHARNPWEIRVIASRLRKKTITVIFGEFGAKAVKIRADSADSFPWKISFQSELWCVMMKTLISSGGRWGRGQLLRLGDTIPNSVHLSHPSLKMNYLILTSQSLSSQTIFSGILSWSIFIFPL